MLKRLSLFTILCALVVGFSACSSDDEPSAEGIVGRWLRVDSWSVEPNGEVDDEGSGNEDNESCFVFNGDGTGYGCIKPEVDDENERANFTYTFIGETLRIVYKDIYGDGWQIGGGHDESGHLILIYQIEWLNNNKFKGTYVYKDGAYDVEIYERF